MTAELMARAQAGDIDAFGELYARYREPVLRLARKLLPAHAEDITQDVFVRALGAIGGWSDQGKEPLAWLNTITRNLCHDRARSAHERRSRPVSFDGQMDFEFPDEAAGPEALAVDDLVHRELLLALADLRDEFREVIVLAYFKDLRCREIAEVLGINEGAVKGRLYRARNALAVLLAKPTEEK